MTGPDMQSDTIILQADHLSKQFDLHEGFFARAGKIVYALNDVSFVIAKGESYGLVGESGCGKTTTARLLIGMYRPDSGRVLYSDSETDIALFKKESLKSYREKIKYIFQDPARSLNPRMSVFEILTAALRYSSQWKDRDDAYARASEIIEEVGLTPADLERRPSEFSGGQRQRISIARGLIMEPELLICDEIVSALDVSIQGQILNLLQDIKKKRNLGYLFIAHDLKVSCWFCDRIGVMYRGILVEEAPAASLYKTALHPYTRLLFDGAQGAWTQSSAEVKTTLKKESGCPFAHRCPLVSDRCRRQCPDLIQISATHKVRCWERQ